MQLNSSPFSLVKKRVFSFAKYPQSPLFNVGRKQNNYYMHKHKLFAEHGAGLEGGGGGGG